jgi:glutathione S-transferase
MITLYGFGPGFGLPEISPFVTKTEVQLQMMGLRYIKQRATPDTAPKGQLPYIDDAGERIGDSTFIRAHLERKHGADLDARLSGRQRAQAWAMERMIENHFSPTVSYFRWLDPVNFERGPGRWFDGLPEPARSEAKEGVRARVAQAMKAVGVARHSRQEVVELGMGSLSALWVLLDGKPYLFGEEPCGVDATAFAVLAGLFTPFFDSPLRDRAVEEYPDLVAYTDRLMRRHYPSHGWNEVEAPMIAA